MMKQEQTEVQMVTMARDFLTYLCRGQILDCMMAARKMADIWGVKLDHHYFSDAMDWMEYCGQVRRVNRNEEFTKYLIL